MSATQLWVTNDNCALVLSTVTPSFCTFKNLSRPQLPSIRRGMPVDKAPGRKRVLFEVEATIQWLKASISYFDDLLADDLRRLAIPLSPRPHEVSL